MLRYRMWLIIHLLKKNDFPSVYRLLHFPGYKDAVTVLHNSGCVEPVIRDGALVDLELRDEHLLYQLSREDVWSNRFWGFIFGIASAVTVGLITGILHI